MDKKYRTARIWSNKTLRKYAHFFTGSVVNVSGWRDEDKQGALYSSYFVNADSYSITNYGGKCGDSEGRLSYPEYSLDLTQPLPDILKLKFDVAFNHTTLEHIYENRIAFKNICDMAREAVIIVVPWVQQVHTVEGVFSDYWRFSPYAMEKMFSENGFSMIVCEHNNEFNSAVYLFCIGIRNSKLSKFSEIEKLRNVSEISSPAGGWIGTNFLVEKVKTLIYRFR